MAMPPVDIKKLDVLQAQINVSISQARSLVDSWLPPALSTTPAGQTSSTSLYSPLPPDDNDDIFKPKPPRLGLGAPVPKHFYGDNQKLRKDISAVDLLKRRLLGSKRNASQMSDKPMHSYGKHQNGKSSKVESESEEEEGRSALGKLKRKKVKDEKEKEKEKARQESEVKQQKGDKREAEVGVSAGLLVEEKKHLAGEEQQEADKTKVNQSNPATSKLQSPNGGGGANEPAKKKKKKKKNRNKQKGTNQSPGS